MADPTTLKDLAHTNLSAGQARTTAARAESGAAQTAVSGAVAALTAATQALAAATADGQRIRTELAAIPTTADATPLLQALDTATIAQRAAEANILAAERTLALARDRLERAALALREAEFGRVRAQTEATAADREATRVAALVAALGQPPLKTLAAQATALLGSAAATAAATAVEKDLPAKLLERARSRVTIARERISNTAAARDAFAAQIQLQIDDHGSTADQLAGPRAEYAAALAGLESYVGGAKQRLDRAQGALTRLADPAQKAALTAAQVTRLNDPAQAAAREAAANLELALDEARRDREAAEQARDLEQAKKAAGDPDTLAAKEADLVTRKQAETAAKGDYDLARQTLLSAWEAAAPDGTLADLLAYDDAMKALDELATQAPSPPTLAAKESNLVAAMVALDKEQTARALYAAQLAARTAAVTFDAGAAERIAFAALRGDA